MSYRKRKFKPIKRDPYADKIYMQNPGVNTNYGKWKKSPLNGLATTMAKFPAELNALTGSYRSG